MSAERKVREIEIEPFDPAKVELYRSWTPAQRVAAGLAMSAEYLRNERETIVRDHPEWTQEEVTAELVEKLHGPEMAALVRRGRSLP